MEVDVRAVLIAIGAFLVVEFIKDAAEKRDVRRREADALKAAKDAEHGARRAEAATEAAEVEHRQEVRDGKSMQERARDLLGLARDLLNGRGSRH